MHPRWRFLCNFRDWKPVARYLQSSGAAAWWAIKKNLPCVVEHLISLMWCGMCTCATPAEDTESSAFVMACILVVDSIQSSMPVDDNSWDRIHELTCQMSSSERQRISHELHNATLSTRLGTHIPAWSALNPNTLYERFVDNGRWIDSIDTVDAGRAGTRGRWRETSDEGDATAVHRLAFSNYRRSRRASDRQMYERYLPLLKERFPYICWDDVPSTPSSAWRRIHVERDLETYEMQRAFVYATRDVTCFRARHTMDLKREFTSLQLEINRQHGGDADKHVDNLLK
jgi:hypothetical protein